MKRGMTNYMGNSDIRVSESGLPVAVRPQLLSLAFILFFLPVALCFFAADSTLPANHDLDSYFVDNGDSLLGSEESDRGTSRDAIRFNVVRVPPCPLLTQSHSHRVSAFKLQITPFRFCASALTSTTAVSTRFASNGAQLACFHFQNVLSRAIPVRAGPRA